MRSQKWQFSGRSQGMRTITDSYIAWLPALLQISDAAFPTGSYAHSHGLEELVRQGAVCDEESLHEFFEERVLPALTYVDLPLAREARFAAISGDRDDLMAVDRLAGALRIPHELREASLQIGRSRLAILIRLRSTPELEALAQIIHEDPRAGHHADVWGVSCPESPVNASRWIQGAGRRRRGSRCGTRDGGVATPSRTGVCAGPPAHSPSSVRAGLMGSKR